MALTMQAAVCSSSFVSGAPLIGVRGSPSPCKRARTLSPRSSLVLPGEDECGLSIVDYEDVASAWISADFLDLRMRSSGLICNEAVQALRKHFQKKSDQQPAAEPTTAVNVVSTSVPQQVVGLAAPSAVQIQHLPRVIFYDDALYSQLYNSSSSTQTTMCSFLDESFC